MIYLKILVVFVLLFVLVSEGAIQYINRTTNTSADPDFVVVLGNGSDPNNPSLNERLTRTIEALKLYPNSKALISGDESSNEVEPMKRYLIQNGIDESRVLVDARSRSTWESAMNTLKVLSHKSSQALVVTNDFHMNRALATFKVAGINAQAYGRDSRPLPAKLYYFIRERLSRIKWLAQYVQLQLKSREKEAPRR